MLTLKSLNAAFRLAGEHGEGAHHFGRGSDPMVKVPRDNLARPRSENVQPAAKEPPEENK